MRQKSDSIKRLVSICTLFFLIAFLISVPALAQEVTAGITGTVVDQGGSPVKGAIVTATDTDRGTSFSSETNDTGAFNIARVPVGTYKVKASSQGFQTAVYPPFTLVLNQTARLDFKLKVGQVTESVEVTSTAPVLQTETTELSTIIDARANTTLPLATRNYNQLSLLAPGSVSTNPGSFTGAQASFQVGRPYINGNREQTNNYILDGMDNNQIDNNDVAYAPSVDAIQEFNLITQNASAEFGNYLGGVINASIKSGTNHYHGDVFWFVRNDKFNANTWANGLTRGGPFTPGATNRDGTGRKPLLRWNEFGGTVGGPIIKNKLFFFADFQGSRFDQPGTNQQFTVFTARERTGDFGEFCTAGFTGGICNNLAQQLYNPFSSANPTTRTPFLNNQIPAGLFSPAARAILTSALYPLPINGGTQNNQTNFTHSNTNTNQGDFKIDWTPGEKDRVFFRYSQQGVTNPTTNSQKLIGDTLNDFPLQNGVVDWTRTITPSVVNDGRIGISYFPVTLGVSNPTGQNLAQVFGIAGVPDTLLPQLNLSGGFINGAGNFVGNNDAKNQFADTVIQAEDTVTWTVGKHTWHIGTQLFRYRTNIFYPGNEGLAGQLFFNGQFTSRGAASPGMGEADFLLGLPNQIGLGSGAGSRGMRNLIYSAFAQDNWRITNNLTLNLGLRYELTTARHEVHDLATNYGLLTGQVQLAGQNGASESLYNTYNGITNFQPRIGLAWSPDFLKNTVFRAAYGISNFAESTGTNNLLFQNPPFTIPHNVTYLTTQALPATTLDQGFSSFPTAACTPAAALASAPACFQSSTLHAFDPNFRPAVSQQWNVSIQHQFGRSTTLQMGYVGQRTQHLVDIYRADQLVLNPNGTTSPSPFLSGNPTLKGEAGFVRVTESGAFANYHALQTVFQQRLSDGLQFQANYTFSKCLNNSSGFFAQYGDTQPGKTQAGNDYFFFQNTFNKRGDYGLCPNDVKHAFNGYVSYDLPYGHGRKFGSHANAVLNAIAGEWQVNSIFNFHTGFPITAQGPDNSGTGSVFPRANCLSGVSHDGSQRYLFGPTGLPTGIQWLNPAAVTAALPGTFGNCAVGSFRGPALTTADLSVSKHFSITERQDLEFRVEAINFTNTPIFAAPADRVGPTFGQVTQAQGERNVQFALKYHF